MYIGVDVGGTNLVAGLTNENGQIIKKVSCPVDRSLDGDALCLEVAKLCKGLIAAEELEEDAVKAIGVGVPGLVDNEAGLVVQTANMPFRNTPFRALLQAELNIPVFLGNDANCAAIGEYWAGAAMGCDPAVIVTLGTGIGGGMVCNGKLFTGFAGSGMEAGHMITRPGGDRCGCGNQGCWERYGSASALIRITKEEMEGDRDSVLWALCDGSLDRVEGRTSFQGAEQGDETSKRILDRYLQGLAEGMINLVNILQPEIICMGGGISGAKEELLLVPLRKLVNESTYDKNRPTKIVRAILGNDAGIVGAAMLCNMV